jgi:hypothetical protein
MNIMVCRTRQDSDLARSGGALRRGTCPCGCADSFLVRAGQGVRRGRGSCGGRRPRVLGDVAGALKTAAYTQPRSGRGDACAYVGERRHVGRFGRGAACGAAIGRRRQPWQLSPHSRCKGRPRLDSRVPRGICSGLVSLQGGIPDRAHVAGGAGAIHRRRRQDGRISGNRARHHRRQSWAQLVIQVQPGRNGDAVRPVQSRARPRSRLEGGPAGGPRTRPIQWIWSNADACPASSTGVS